MPSAATLSNTEAILAAAQELQLRRLAAAPSAPAAPKARQAGSASKTVRCRLRVRKSEYRELVKLKKRLARSGLATSKAQLIRAGLLLLAQVDLIDLKVAIRDVIAPEALLYKIK